MSPVRARRALGRIQYCVRPRRSAEFVNPWFRDRRDFEWSELVLFRPEVSFGFHGLVPGDFLAAVAGFTADDAGERAFGNVLGFVNRLAGADAGDQIFVLGL